MKINKSMSINRFMALVIAGTLVATPVFADKPDNAGKGKSHNDRDNRDGKHSDRDDRNKVGKHDDRAQGSQKHFGNNQQVIVRDYFAQEYRSGSCPPGLAKKNNGCMPPGKRKSGTRASRCRVTSCFTKFRSHCWYASARLLPGTSMSGSLRTSY